MDSTLSERIAQRSHDRRPPAFLAGRLDAPCFRDLDADMAVPVRLLSAAACAELRRDLESWLADAQAQAKVLSAELDAREDELSPQQRLLEAVA